jgi:hypothetical protein
LAARQSREPLRTMTEIAPKEAILRARKALGLPASVSGQALHVERLDAPASAYYLILLASGGRKRHVALINARTGAIDQDAELTGNASHIMVNKEQAIAAARLGGHPSARLVWRPCRASHSPLYPIWEISSESERRYVDQQGRLWDVLRPIGRGGGS